MKKISIITTVLNGEKTIESCLRSVAGQSVDVEHIIVDACSTDKTLKIARGFSSVTQIISENDRGIYDGLNKGLQLASGDIIGFLHADDFFADSQILKSIVELFSDKDIDSCYGDLLYVDRSNTQRVLRYWKSGEYDCTRFRWGWMPPHPAFFARRELYEKYGGFRLDMGTAADYELMLRFLAKYRATCIYLPRIITKMRAGGQSNISIKNRLMANVNDRRAWRINGLKPYPWTLIFKPLSKIKQFFQKPRISTLYYYLKK